MIIEKILFSAIFVVTLCFTSLVGQSNEPDFAIWRLYHQENSTQVFGTTSNKNINNLQFRIEQFCRKGKKRKVWIKGEAANFRRILHIHQDTLYTLYSEFSFQKGRDILVFGKVMRGETISIQSSDTIVLPRSANVGFGGNKVYSLEDSTRQFLYRIQSNGNKVLIKDLGKHEWYRRMYALSPDGKHLGGLVHHQNSYAISLFDLTQDIEYGPFQIQNLTNDLLGTFEYRFHCKFISDELFAVWTTDFEDNTHFTIFQLSVGGAREIWHHKLPREIVVYDAVWLGKKSRLVVGGVKRKDINALLHIKVSPDSVSVLNQNFEFYLEEIKLSAIK